MKSIRRLLRQLISGEGRTPIIFPSMSLSSLNEVVTGINGPAELPGNSSSSLNNISYSSPPPSPPAPVPPDADERTSHEVITIQSDINDIAPPAGDQVDIRVEDENGENVATNPADDLGELFQRLPTPPTTAPSENESNENDENQEEIIRSPAEFPCNLPSPPSSSLPESEDEQNDEERADPTPGLDNTNDEGQNQEHLDTSHNHELPSSSDDDDENSGPPAPPGQRDNGTSDESCHQELNNVSRHQDYVILDELNVDVSSLTKWSEPHIVQHFRFLYHFGVVPFRFCARAEERFQLEFVHTVAYLCVLMMAVIYLLYVLKICIFQEEIENAKLKFCVKLAFVANAVSLPVYFAIVMWRFKSNVASMINTTRALAAISANVIAPNPTKQKVVMLVTMTITVLSGLLFPLLFTASQSGFDATEVLRYQAQDFGYAISGWKRDLNLTAFFDEYEGDMNWQTISMGLTWGTLSMIGCAYESLVHDVPMWLAITMLGYTSCLSTALSTTELAQRHRQEIWKMYRLLTAYSSQIDLYFGDFLQIVHFQNLFFSSYMLYYTIIEEEVGWYSAVQVQNLGKMVIFYVASAKAADINDTLSKWLSKNHRMDDIMYENGVVGVTASVVIADVSKNPIGIGSKMFFVNKSSIWKGVSIVGSCFMFFVDSADAVVLNTD